MGTLPKCSQHIFLLARFETTCISFTVFLGFLWMLLLVAYGQRDENGFYLTQHIRQSFSKGISDSMDQSDVFTWANTALLKNLFENPKGT